MKTIPELSKQFDLPATTIRSAALEGRIPGERRGRDWWIDDEDAKFVEWLAARASQPRVKGKKDEKT